MSASDPFEVIPAIDLLDGNAVRLSQGRYDEATVYDSDPAKVADRFAAVGIRRLHVVDLEGAKVGRPVQGEAVKRIQNICYCCFTKLIQFCHLVNFLSSILH